MTTLQLGAPDSGAMTVAGPYLRRATLAGGLRVAVRELRPSDREELAAGFAQLSERSRFSRFLSGKPTMTPTDLRLLVDDVDQHDHVAVVLVWPRTSRPDVLIGEARFIRSRLDPGIADVAVTVADEIQGQGAGRLLIGVLADLAVERGITRFTGTLLPSNAASARMLASAGVVAEDRVESGTREIVVRLTGRSAGIAGTGRS